MVSISNWGTFDIANFGDLLFPLILQQELEKRLGSVAITLSSPQGGPFLPDPAQRVNRIIRMEDPAFFRQASDHAAVVLGGGDIVRFDDAVMAGLYDTSVEQAAASRFMRAFLVDLGLLARAVPVFWNAVGVTFDFAPEVYEQVRKSVKLVQYVSVRDETSRKRLEAAGVDREIRLVPDSAFLLEDLLPKRDLEPVIARLEAAGTFPGGRK